MAHIVRQCGSMIRCLRLARPNTPICTTSKALFMPGTSASTPAHWSLPMALPTLESTRDYATKTKANQRTSLGKVDCACSGHPWPEDKKKFKIIKEKAKDCLFDFRKIEVNPYDNPCGCIDPPPASGCADLGKSQEVCCRSTRQYGCHCEEEIEEEPTDYKEEEEVVVVKTCDLDFRKLEVNPYDDPCECVDPPPATSCATLAEKQDVCCRSPRPFGCDCEAYDKPGLPCTQPKGPAQKKKTTS